MSWTPFGAPHPAPAARHTAALTNTPEGPVMVQFGAHDLLVWHWTGAAWRVWGLVLTREEGYPWEDGRPKCGSLVAYYDEAARTPIVGYVERSGAAVLSSLDGSEPLVITDSGQYGGETVAVFDPATRGPLLRGGSHTSVVHDDGTVTLHTGDRASPDTLAADPHASRVVGLDWDAATYAWAGEGWRELSPAPRGTHSYLPHSTLAYCPARKRVLCLFEDADGEAMELRALDGDRWVTVTPRVRLPVVRKGALLGVGAASTCSSPVSCGAWPTPSGAAWRRHRKGSPTAENTGCGTTRDGGHYLPRPWAVRRTPARCGRWPVAGFGRSPRCLERPPPRY